MDETARRRAKQIEYNHERGITPQSIIKAVDMELAAIVEADYVQVSTEDSLVDEYATEQQLRQAIADLEIKMREAAKKFEFEQAAQIRDRIRALKQRTVEMYVPAEAPSRVEANAPVEQNAAPEPPVPSRRKKR
jgi:excinuclease ABC subunit B